jgi:hypothetical protein
MHDVMVCSGQSDIDAAMTLDTRRQTSPADRTRLPPSLKLPTRRRHRHKFWMVMVLSENRPGRGSPRLGQVISRLRATALQLDPKSR